MGYQSHFNSKLFATGKTKASTPIILRKEKNLSLPDTKRGAEYILDKVKSV